MSRTAAPPGMPARGVLTARAADATDPTGAPRKASLWQRIRRERAMYAFALPGFAFFVVFAYLPLLGNVAAFQDYSPFVGFTGSPWVGLDNFVAIFSDPAVGIALRNTLVVSLLQIVFAFPAPIALALLLNSLVSERFKRFVQTIVYLPHFLSWVIVVAVWQAVVGGAGPLADLLGYLGASHTNLMADPGTFKVLLTSQVIWKDVGWGTIIYFAAITSIAPELYESAAVDGAGAWRRIWHVTLPALVPVTLLLLILRIGSVLTVGFEQILLQEPTVGSDAAQVLDTFAYFRGVVGGDWGLSTAAGLLKGVVGTVLIVAANKLAKRAGTEGLF